MVAARARLKNAVLAPRPPTTFAVVKKAAAPLTVDATLRLVSVPTVVTFVWVF